MLGLQIYIVGEFRLASAGLEVQVVSLCNNSRCAFRPSDAWLCS